MATKDYTERAGVYAQRLVDNEYVQDNLAQAAENLRAAVRRASKRRVEPTRDEKIRQQVRQAAQSLSEAASALKTGRTKPKKRRGRKVLVMLVVGGGVAAAIVASNEELRNKLFGGGPGGDGQPAETTPAGSSSETPVAA
jgi:hypothetical protein